MTNLPPPDLSPERPVRSEYTLPRTYRIRRVITCVVLVMLVAGSAYGVYTWKRAPIEIPTIKAEGPLKQKPEQPGGIDIPNQDVLAYQQIDNSGNKTPPPVEHLLPPPETPQTAAPPQISTPNTAPPPAPAVETLLAPPPPPPIATTVTPEKPKQTSQTEMAPTPDAAPRSAVVEASVDSRAVPSPASDPTPQTENQAPAANDEDTAKPGKTGFRIQLASFPDKEIAEHQMAHMVKRFAAQLGETKLHLLKADLGPRGIYYRVQSNPITDVEARDICDAISKLKAGCIVVKP